MKPESSGSNQLVGVSWLWCSVVTVGCQLSFVASLYVLLFRARSEEGGEGSVEGEEHTYIAARVVDEELWERTPLPCIWN